VKGKDEGKQREKGTKRTGDEEKRVKGDNDRGVTERGV
jgi:hypothetical protein